ncbi:MAG: hypothetical protein Udaeo_06530 [Candidatus Udaeobacter sp.]|nr:MAG: hypothetical protein Udaeo_06530 [Candidatus Udaeobacter sp.]
MRATDKHATEGDLSEKHQRELAADFLKTNSPAFRFDHAQRTLVRFDAQPDSLGPKGTRIFAIVSRPIRLSEGAAPIRRVLIFDDHPATIRLLDDLDRTEKRKDRLALVAFSALMGLLMLAMFWPLI